MENHNKGGTIKPDGEDFLSRVGRTNDLVLTKHIRAALNIGIADAKVLVDALRQTDFPSEQKAMIEILDRCGLDFGPGNQVALTRALASAFEAISEKSPLGTLDV